MGDDNDYNSDGYAHYNDLIMGAEPEEDSVNFTSGQQPQSYTVLNESDIRKCQEDDITRLSTVLSIPRIDASILLLHYKWSVDEVNDAWFTDEDGVRKSVGLLEKPVVNLTNAKDLTCGICLESFTPDHVSSAACSHPFCNLCWKGYISTSVNDGCGCLMLRCPDPSCQAAVGQDMIDLLASDEDKKKYSRYLLTSYVENNRKLKWCPAPGCNYAVAGSGTSNVSCLCSFRFCWNCTEDVHVPVDCETVLKWISNIAESESMNWLQANSKRCPKCKTRIEKTEGCMHMKCYQYCRYEFCWLCLGAWSGHGRSRNTRGFNSCNGYNSSKQAKRKRKMPKNSSDAKYTHYYQRWAENQSSRQKALRDFHEMRTANLEKLGNIHHKSALELKFITEAWLQIVECRCVLKWTYAYGYYLPEHELAKRHFFEYLQGEAESGLERLHQCAEKEIQQFLNMNSPSKEFDDFLVKLEELTRTTKKYFGNLVEALENGLADVDSHAATSNQTTSSENMKRASKRTRASKAPAKAAKRSRKRGSR